MYKSHLDVQDLPSVVQFAVQSQAGRDQAGESACKCMENLGRGKETLKAEKQYAKRHRTVCVRYSDTSAIGVSGQVQKRKQVANILFT